MFYTPMCPHCQANIPAVQEFADKFKGEINVGSVIM